jgi:hypothetical protein
MARKVSRISEQRTSKIFGEFAADLVNATWKKLRRVYRPTCCIAAAATTLKVLDRFGVPAAELPVKVLVFNRTTWAFTEEYELCHGAMPEAESPLYDEWESRGAWSVALGYCKEEAPAGYNGHLAVLTAGGVLLDPSLPQVNRPHKAIVVPPGYGPVPDGFVSGTQAILVESGNAVVRYEVGKGPGVKHWYDAHDWQAPVNQAVADAVVADLHDRGWR